LDKKVDEAFHAPSAFFIRSPSGFEWFGLRFAPVGAKRVPQARSALSWTLDKKVDEAFMPHPLFLFEARRASKGSVSASTVKYKSSAEEMFMEYFIAYWFLFNYD
jgi:hypothetical protein